MKIKLSEIVDCMQSTSDEIIYYVNIKTGETIFIGEMIENDIEIEDVDNDDNYIVLPSKFEINEYSIMEDYIGTIQDVQKQEQLNNAIHGKGAFRYFKDKLYELNMVNEWYEFLNEKERQIAIDWCKKNNLQYED